MQSQRKKKLINGKLQGKLIKSAVLLEIFLLAATLFYLNTRFASLIEHDLYSVHRSNQSDLLAAFAAEIVRTVIVLILINAMLLLIAHSWWSRQIRSMTQALRYDLCSVASLQFPASKVQKHHTHELQGLLDRWLELERTRNLQLKQEISGIRLSATPGPQELEGLQQRFVHCMELLKPASTTAGTT